MKFIWFETEHEGAEDLFLDDRVVEELEIQTLEALDAFGTQVRKDELLVCLREAKSSLNI